MAQVGMDQIEAANIARKGKNMKLDLNGLKAIFIIF